MHPKFNAKFIINSSFIFCLDHSRRRGILDEVVLIHGVVELLLLAVHMGVQFTGHVLLVILLHGLNCLVIKVIILVVSVLGLFVVDSLGLGLSICVPWILLDRSCSILVMGLLVDLKINVS